MHSNVHGCLTLIKCIGKILVHACRNLEPVYELVCVYCIHVVVCVYMCLHVQACVTVCDG